MKHPSGLLEFAGRLHNLDFYKKLNSEKNTEKNKAAEIPATFIEDISCVDFSDVLTPASLFLKNTAEDYFQKAAQTAKDLSGDIKVSNAYSMKTNPDEKLIKLAKRNDFYAEGISLLEAQKAIAAGFSPEKIILNGPGKWWNKELLPDAPFYCIFCDSLEELAYVSEKIRTGELETKTLDIRLRTPNIQSRFGIPIETPDDFQNLVEAVKNIDANVKFGVHFHMASSNVGVGNWWHLFESMLHWYGSLEALSGNLIEILDIGGGWFPEDLQKDSGEKFRKAVELVPDFLPNVGEIICEPGKALAQPSTALAMRILEIRRFADGKKEAVVDGSIAELPMYSFYPHRILHKNGVWKSLGRGNTKLLGRLCMEHDIVAANVDLPETAKAGDVLVFCDAGAYDRSHESFGRKSAA